jgi:ABC-type branched-subunit amino acid transport system substrate-binding protein
MINTFYQSDGSVSIIFYRCTTLTFTLDVWSSAEGIAMKRASIAVTGLVATGLGSSTVPAGAAAELKLGVFLPVTGPTADSGAQMRNGTELACLLRPAQ